MKNPLLAQVNKFRADIEKEPYQIDKIKYAVNTWSNGAIDITAFVKYTDTEDYDPIWDIEHQVEYGAPHDAGSEDYILCDTWDEAYNKALEIKNSDDWKDKYEQHIKDCQMESQGICSKCGKKMEWQMDFSNAQWTAGDSLANLDECMDNGGYVCPENCEYVLG